MAALETLAKEKLGLEQRFSVVQPSLETLTGQTVEFRSAPLAKHDELLRVQLVSSMALDVTLTEAIVALANRVNTLEAEIAALRGSANKKEVKS